jgi:hypothetical protein
MNKPREKTKKTSIRTTLGLSREKGVITEILFTEHTPNKKGLREARITIDNIVAFGTRHEPVLNDEGDFRRFDKVGYIENTTREYITSKFVVKELRKYLKKKITAIVKETVVGQTKKTTITAHNWRYNL